MPRWQRVYLATCAAVIGYSLGCTICHFGSFPLLIYAPHERAWTWAERASSPLSITYYGVLLWGAGGAAAAGTLAWLAAGRVRAPLERRWLNLAGAWALTAVGLAAAYYLWNLWPF